MQVRIMDILKEVFLFLFRRQIEFVGVFPFYTTQKSVLTDKGTKISQNCLELSSEGRKYRKLLIVSNEEYKKAKLNKQFCQCSVVVNKRNKNAILLSRILNEDEVIKATVNTARTKLLFLTISFGVLFLIFMFTASFIMNAFKF